MTLTGWPHVTTNTPEVFIKTEKYRRMSERFICLCENHFLEMNYFVRPCQSFCQTPWGICDNDNQWMWFSLKWQRVKGRVEAESLFDDSLEAREYQLHVLAVWDRAEDTGGSILILRYILRGQCSGWGSLKRLYLFTWPPICMFDVQCLHYTCPTFEIFEAQCKI